MSSGVGSRAFQNARLLKQHRKQAEILLPHAIAAYRQNRHADVQAICRQILNDLPNHFDALHLLGVSCIDTRQLKDAEEFLTRAVMVESRSAEAHSNLGIALFEQKRYAEARKCQERAISLKPNFPTAQTNLGNVLMRLGLVLEAVAAHDRAIKQKPDYADAYCNRGMAQLLLEQLDLADQSFDRALSLQAGHAQAIVGKGQVSVGRRHYEAAQTAFDTALAIQPGVAEIIAFRGGLFQRLGETARAEADFDTALAIDPTLQPAWLGKAQIGLDGNIAQAITACTKVLEQNPDSETAITLLGACHARQGDIAGAIEHYDRALSIKPDHEDAITRKIFTLDFAPNANFAIHQAARRVWWDNIGVRLPRMQLPSAKPDPAKRIVVGYVSYDIRSHSAALAFMPVFRNHDRSAFEIIAYSCSPRHDAVTEECRSLVDSFVDACRMSDDELASRIQADGVDILVDLSGHSAGNRLRVFARKPAPVQVTAWGSGTGTGVITMDYFLADPVTVPPDARHLFAEKIHDLPCVITTAPLPGAAPSTLPMLRNGHVTFGVFNRVDKISDDVLVVWSRLMRELDSSGMIVKNVALDDPFLRDRLIARFMANGISPDRVRCMGSSSRQDHLAAFSEVDISLDPFPQNGGVSTFESLQMGVPVVCKLGESASSRLGAAIVKAANLDEWVARDDDAYIAIARKFAVAPSELKSLRAELPARVAASPAGNAAIYTRHVEDGYRSFWRNYCAQFS